VVALGALAVGALSIAVTLAASDADRWPGWLRPYHRWGWWSVLGLLVAAVALTVWQVVRQPTTTTTTTPAPPTAVHAADSGVAGGDDVTITGAQGPTAGRDARTVTGGAGPTAGGDLHITTTGPVSAPAVAAGLIANLPPRNLAFTGREELLDRLHQQLTTPTAAVAVTALADDNMPGGVAPDAEMSQAEVRAPRVLYGLGGVGKTQLATEYAYRHANGYRIRWWIPAEQPAAIPGHLVALACELGIPEQAEQTETVAALLAELGGRDDWLLVFDNAEDPHDLRPYWPSTDAGGRVLVTSRNPNWQPLAVTLPVDVLPRADAIAFLRRRVGLDTEDADALAEALGDLPLALEQAAAYLQQTTTPPGEYLDLLATRARELFALGPPATSEQTIATIWTVSTHQLRERTPAAEDLLMLFAFLAADDIPRALPAQHPDQLPERLAATVQDPLAYQQAIGALRRFSLITTSQDSEALSVHRLVQAVTRQQLNPTQERDWVTAALRLLRAAFPDRHADPDTWPDYARLLPHVMAVTDHASAHGMEFDKTAWLLREAGLYLWQRADHQQAQSLFERARAIFEARLGPDHPGTADNLNNLALVLRDQGDLQGARTLHERALAIREARLGPDHPTTADNLDNLALVLRHQGDLQGAHTLHERALAIREARLGPDHPTTAHSLNNLALVLRHQGDLQGARTLHERALAIYEARLGPDHPTTARGLNNLALVLHAWGDLQGAHTLHERALAIREARLGPDHPTTAHSLNNLALVLRHQGDLQGARTLYERALAIYEARLGPDHPDTVRIQQRLAALLAVLENRQ